MIPDKLWDRKMRKTMEEITTEKKMVADLFKKVFGEDTDEKKSSYGFKDIIPESIKYKKASDYKCRHHERGKLRYQLKNGRVISQTVRKEMKEEIFDGLINYLKESGVRKYYPGCNKLLDVSDIDITTLEIHNEAGQHADETLLSYNRSSNGEYATFKCKKQDVRKIIKRHNALFEHNYIVFDDFLINLDTAIPQSFTIKNQDDGKFVEYTTIDGDTVEKYTQYERYECYKGLQKIASKYNKMNQYGVRYLVSLQGNIIDANTIIPSSLKRTFDNKTKVITITYLDSETNKECIFISEQSKKLTKFLNGILKRTDPAEQKDI